MNLDDPEDREAAAGEYVAGSLAADDREAFEHRLARDPALLGTVYEWSDRLVDLSRRAPPLDPPAALWTKIEARLTAPPASTSPQPTVLVTPSRWRGVGAWRAATGLALAASLVLGVMLASRDLRTAPAHRYLAVLQSPTDKEAGWVVEGSSNDGVRLVPIGHPAAAPAGKALQFWTKPDGASGPTSLGLVHAGEAASVAIDRLPSLGDRQLFEVTLEPEGGSPLGKPTGPVLYVGRTVSL